MIQFLRSMKFGMLLLVLVIACSFAGSMIVQQREPMEYVNRYGAEWAKLIMALGLDDVFSAPYFFALMAGLCLNLTLCSIARLPRTVRAAHALRSRARSESAIQQLDGQQAEKLRVFLKNRHYRCEKGERGEVYTKNLIGFYGSFLTHLSFLLILVVGAAAVMTAEVTDRTVIPGETITLEDGVHVTVEAFQIVDGEGRLDFASKLTASSGEGKNSIQREIRVNEPLAFAGYKIYQQTYGTAGCVRIENHATGAAEDMPLTDACFLTLDGRNGIFYQALYPGYIRAEDGTVTLITSTSGAYTDPVYDLLSVADGEMTPVLAFPGETLTIGDVSFTMLDPVSYPGLRIKHMNTLILGMLYTVFALMIAALYLCFFMVPVAIRVEDGGFCIVSPKTQTGLMIDIEALLNEEEN